MIDNNDKERIASLEANLGSVQKEVLETKDSLKDGFSRLEKAIADSHLHLEKAQDDHARQMQNVVNNGLHQAQGLAESAKDMVVNDLKPKVEKNQAELNELKLQVAKLPTSKSFEKLSDKLDMLNSRTLIWIGGITVMAFAFSNIDKIAGLIK